MSEEARNEETRKGQGQQEVSRRSEENPSKKEEGTPIYLTSDSTLQTPAEHAHDQSVDPTKNIKMESSNDDLHDINAGKLTGRDGTDTDQP